MTHTRRRPDAFDLLRAGIPLTLLIDLARPDPCSRELYKSEGSTRKPRR